MSNAETRPDTEKDVDPSLLIDDHEYDGIQEYDNPLPRWWTTLFWLTIVFSVGYVLVYHVSDRGRSVLETYAAEQKEANERAAAQAAKEQVSEELLTKLASNPAALAKGSEVFEARCVACHGNKGQGVVGPNLTDSHWIHGQGSLMDIYETTASGVAAKGMPAWSRQLSPEELRSVVVFVGSLRGTNQPGKAPEGKEVARH